MVASISVETTARGAELHVQIFVALQRTLLQGSSSGVIADARNQLLNMSGRVSAIQRAS
jgi:hypothetical protein